MNEFQMVREEIADLQSQLAEARKPKVCRWTIHKPGAPIAITSECGHIMERGDGLFCKHCGGKVEVVSDE